MKLKTTVVALLLPASALLGVASAATIGISRKFAKASCGSDSLCRCGNGQP